MSKKKKRPNEQTAKWFDDEAAKFKGVLKHALLISNRIGRYIETPPRGFASWLWMRAGITAQSIERLLVPNESIHGGCYLDQASIATLCRSLIENIAVMRYIGDIEISEDEWRCRHYVIQLYDVVHRGEFLKMIGADVKGGTRDREILTKKLQDNKFFQRVPTKRQKRLLKGDDMFIDGRHNALLALGWGNEGTKGVYKYLSNQAHSLSMSFQRTEENRLYEKDSPYAKMTAAFGLAWARLALGFGCMHMLTLFPRIEAEFNPFVLTALKKEYTPEPDEQPIVHPRDRRD